jgi:hypothetical protein
MTQEGKSRVQERVQEGPSPRAKDIIRVFGSGLESRDRRLANVLSIVKRINLTLSSPGWEVKLISIEMPQRLAPTSRSHRTALL